VLLEPLTASETERLIDNLLGESDLPDVVRDYVVDRSGGNPLFVEELLATLVDREVLQREGGRWTTTQVPAIPLPSTVQALVSARIDRLPDAERVVLELASVEGAEFHRQSVADLGGPDAMFDLDASLAALVRKELVRSQPGESGRFVFRHALIREAAYESIPLPRRGDLHERLTGSTAGERADYHRDQAARYRAALGGL